VWILTLLLLAWLAIYRLKVLVDQIPAPPRTIGFATYEKIAISAYNPIGIKRYTLKKDSK
jgi:hypothetical protein